MNQVPSSAANPFPTIVTWVLVVAGWYLVHLAALSRARRQEDLDLIRSIEGRVTALRDRAVKYYTGTTGNEDPAREMAAGLKLELKSLSSAVRILRRRHPKRYDLAGDFIALRAAATGGQFEETQRRPAPADGEVIQQLWDAADVVCCSLRDEFEKTHRWWM